MIEFSHPSPADIPALVALWNASMPPAFPLSERLLRQIITDDPYYEPEGHWVARDRSAGGDIAGWVLSKSMRAAGPEVGRFQNRGGVGALCVHPDYQRRGLGTELLNRAEAWLEQNASPQTLLYFPHHLLPGVPVECESARHFFERRGYGNWHQCVDLERDLSDYEMPPAVRTTLAANPDVEIRPCREEEQQAVIDFVAREFPGAWTYSTRYHFRCGGAASDFVIAVEGSEIIGFCHTGDFGSARLLAGAYWLASGQKYFGGLGPIGMAQAQRKRGLGLALCALAVADLQRRGVARMAIDWTNLVDFYGRLGFAVSRRYLQGEKNRLS